MMRRLLPLLCLMSVPAGAAELRDLCPTRPGLGTSACIVDAGHVLGEVSAIDWTHSRDGAVTEDDVLVGDLLLRVGVGEATELQLGWTPFGAVRVRDRAAGTVTRQQRVGDVTIGMRQNLRHPDGSGFSVALQPFVTLPVGRRTVGAGDWAAGLVVPASYELSDVWSVALTAEADAAADADGNGRHLAWSAIGGTSAKLSEAITATLEVAAQRDDDPAGHATAWLGSASLAWQPRDDVQFDVQAVAGLNHGAPDVELLAGVARRF